MPGLGNSYQRFMDRFVRTSTPDLAEVEKAVWSAKPDNWAAYPESYATALLDQYKLYVETADRISGRRSIANTFFLTLNSAIFTVIGLLWKDRPQDNVWWLVFPLVALLAQCVAWYSLLRSYLQLNAAKYTVIGAMETKLPVSCYWSAEWKALGEGKARSQYLPLTRLEQWIPAIFGVTYIAVFVAVLLA